MELSKLQELFSTAEKIEQEMGEFYTFLAGCHSTEEWNDFWKGIALEEENHARMLVMQRRILSSQKKLEMRESLAIAELRELADNIRMETGRLKSELTTAPAGGVRAILAEVLRATIALETMAGRAHTDQIIVIDDEPTKALFGQLAAADNTHARRMSEFLEKFLAPPGESKQQ